MKKFYTKLVNNSYIHFDHVHVTRTCIINLYNNLNK